MIITSILSQLLVRRCICSGAGRAPYNCLLSSFKKYSSQRNFGRCSNLLTWSCKNFLGLQSENFSSNINTRAPEISIEKWFFIKCKYIASWNIYRKMFLFVWFVVITSLLHTFVCLSKCCYCIINSSKFKCDILWSYRIISIYFDFLDILKYMF